MRPSIKCDGTKVWDFVLIYTDDTLVISENAKSILRNEMGKYFELKTGIHWTTKAVPWWTSPKGSIGEWGQCMGI